MACCGVRGRVAGGFELAGATGEGRLHERRGRPAVQFKLPLACGALAVIAAEEATAGAAGRACIPTHAPRHGLVPSGAHHSPPLQHTLAHPAARRAHARHDKSRGLGTWRDRARQGCQCGGRGLLRCPQHAPRLPPRPAARTWMRLRPRTPADDPRLWSGPRWRPAQPPGWRCAGTCTFGPCSPAGPPACPGCLCPATAQPSRLFPQCMHSALARVLHHNPGMSSSSCNPRLTRRSPIAPLTCCPRVRMVCAWWRAVQNILNFDGGATTFSTWVLSSMPPFRASQNG